MRLLHLLIVYLLGIAVMCAFIVDLIDSRTGNDHVAKQNDAEKNEEKMGDKYDRVFWVVQISDFHISKFYDKQRAPDVVRFCRDYLSVIKPDIVLATGDLVDAKEKDGRGSRQYRAEWEEYHKTMRECSKFHNARWLDIRGNHDAFDVPDLQSQQNLYRQYSAQGLEHTTSYKYVHTTKYGKYSFISVDACPDPGPRRPFNFFGQLNDDRVTELQRHTDETKDSNQTVWFGHYPTSLIVQDPPGVKHIMRRGIVYLCGHLHTLNGLMPNMYTRHKTGMLELELGDWKDNRIFRILVFDHDIMSFLDASLGEWPLVIITNPKDALFQAESHEPLYRQRGSTHIRILIFHTVTIDSVSVYIDNRFLGNAHHVEGPLYVFQWNPLSYSTAIHSIRVTVEDIEGKKKNVQQPFSLDGSRPDFLFAPRILLMMNISSVGKVIYAAMVFVYILFLGFLRQCSNIRNFFFEGESLLEYYVNRWLWKLWLTARTNSIYYPVLGAILYVTFGPWFVGDFLENHTGLLFVWGMYVHGTFIPGSHTYFYGIFHVITFHVPLLLHLSHSLDLLYLASGNLQEVKVRRITPFQRITQTYLPFAIMFLLQLFITATEFPRAYGTKAITLGPVRTGSLFLMSYLQYSLFHVPLQRVQGINYS
ncbi:transmembrane protein 62-like [Haliotis rufescens]|uniref:transmembrane protein 62-like n=1 Tax=Haliotis rufescens TaxID=6454 RepID=UPI00201E9184|nr:transmembrane protein 62-like [Haliotis rufescens]